MCVYSRTRYYGYILAEVYRYTRTIQAGIHIDIVMFLELVENLEPSIDCTWMSGKRSDEALHAGGWSS